MPPGREGRDVTHGVREEIALSWHRVNLSRLDPDAAFDTQVQSDLDLQSPLLAAAAPVLKELEGGLRGSDHSTLLVDRDCRVVRRWFDDPRVEGGFDSLAVTLGASLLEENIGTNALGTAMVIRRGISINGSEHFADALRGFSCYGHPIRHPLTKRIEGALDISAIVERASPLLPPLVSRAVHDIEQRLLAGSRTYEKNLLAAFQAAAGRRRRAVVAIGEDVVISNQAAGDLLSPADVALLRALAEEPQPGGGRTLDLSLASGRAVRIEITEVGGARYGALLRVDPSSGGRAPVAVTRSRPDRVRPATLIAGVPGTGRTTRARERAADSPPLKIMGSASAVLDGASVWARDFETTMRRASGSLCVDGIDVLSDELLDLIIGWVDRPHRPELILTSGPVPGLTGRAAALAGMAPLREELVPLSARRQQIPELAAAMLDEIAADPSVYLTPSVIQTLAAQSWPGNLRELKAVIGHAAKRRSSGGVTRADLPEQYRSSGPQCPMTALDRAEHDVIVTTLKATGGNKMRTARELGISRTTLYARMRALHIATY